MKKKILNIAIVALFAGTILGCSKWTEVEPKNYYKPHGDEYYENLRAYKNSDHPVTFGWFGNWTGKGASLQGSLMGLPDSVDFVSMWGNWHSLTDEKWADKREVKRLKGTRVMMCFIVANIGDQTTPADVRNTLTVDGVTYDTQAEALAAFWGWYMTYDRTGAETHYGDSTPEGIEKAISKYAKSLIDTINKYEWDGFDFDYEANFGASGNIAGPYLGDSGDPEDNRQRTYFLTFIKELGKYLGPKSGTGKLLVIDGEPQNMHPAARDYFDYYIIQAYYSSGYSDLDNRYNKLLRGLEATGNPELEKAIAKKLIYCEDFEKAGYATNGGTNFRTRDGRTVPSLIGMAAWQPLSGYEKGGIGTYHMEYDYPNNPEYKWLRQATGIMNPVIK